MPFYNSQEFESKPELLKGNLQIIACAGSVQSARKTPNPLIIKGFFILRTTFRITFLGYFGCFCSEFHRFTQLLKIYFGCDGERRAQTLGNQKVHYLSLCEKFTITTAAKHLTVPDHF